MKEIPDEAPAPVSSEDFHYTKNSKASGSIQTISVEETVQTALGADAAGQVPLTGDASSERKGEHGVHYKSRERVESSEP